MANQDAKPDTPLKPMVNSGAETRDTDGPDVRRKLGRDRPGEGLDTGVDTGVIQPGKSGGAHGAK
jgi:hypothetical protein